MHAVASFSTFAALERIPEKSRRRLNQFPSFKQDLTLPSAFWGAEDNYFSAIIRVSSGDLQLWTHYDAMDNMLIQLQGKARALVPAVVRGRFISGGLVVHGARRRRTRSHRFPTIRARAARR